jgi:hypothetical protein
MNSLQALELSFYSPIYSANLSKSAEFFHITFCSTHHIVRKSGSVERYAISPSIGRRSPAKYLRSDRVGWPITEMLWQSRACG